MIFNDIVKKRAKRIKQIRIIRESKVFLKLGAKIRAYLFTGILVTAPVAITFYMAYEFILFVDKMVNDAIVQEWNLQKYVPMTIPGIGLLILIAALILIGMFTAGFLGKFIVRLGEWVVFKIPLVSSVYSLLKQVFETFFSNKNQAFSRVVMLQYPRPGTWVLAFVSTDTQQFVSDKLSGEKMINVYVPTTPNPTSGFLLFVPEKDTIEMDMSVEEALKFIISCGIVEPKLIKNSKK